MRAIFAAITIAGVLTAGVSGSAQVRPLAAPPDLSGHWTIVPGADGSSPLGARFAVKQDASTITFTSDRQEVTYKLDDSETVRRTGMANGATSTHSSRARFVSNALVVTTRTDAGATGHWEDLMLVSQDRPGEITVVTSSAKLTERGMATRVYKYKKANDDLPDRLTIQQFWQLSTDRSEPGETFKRQNYMTDEHINRIIKTYQERPETPIDRYARRVEIKVIEENDFNLNISRYVSTAQAEEEIVLADVHAELVKIESEIRDASAKHNAFLKELGLPPLPSGNSD